MKIFAIRDETDKSRKDLAYLFYYETDKRFYIELPENADEWETPLILSTFAKKGEKSINAYWSKLWVCQRIVPPDRQNIGQVLRDNKLKSYDEYDLLMLSMGRCAQDAYYLCPIDTKELPKEVLRRFEKKIEDIVPLQNFNLLVFFRNGTVKKCDMTSYMNENKRFSVFKSKPEYFSHAEIQTGGYGVQWDAALTVSDSELYKMGKTIPLSADDFKRFATERVINAARAAEILHCSRQYINELVRTGKLKPIKTTDKSTVFLKSEVLKRGWQ